MSELQIPSLYNLKCPSCESTELTILGQKGSTGKAVALQVAFGAIGTLIANSGVKAQEETKPLQYKCKQCRKKFVTYPLPATEDELLSAPCKIVFQRVKSMVGMAVLQIVYLNGMRVGPIKSGASFEFETNIKHNTIFVTDLHGMAFRDKYKFEAVAGGSISVQFKRKFIR